MEPTAIAVIVAGIVSALVGIARQIRLARRERREDALLLHIYDQDRGADVLPTLIALRRIPELPFTGSKPIYAKKHAPPPPELTSGEAVSS